MTFSDDHIALAAEYVLGTLDADERIEAEALIAADSVFADLVRKWENRLGELHAMVDPVEPPTALWQRIREATAQIEQGDQISLPLVPLSPLETAEARRASAQGTAQVIDLTQRMRRWRGIATMTAAAAAALALFIAADVYRPDLLPKQLRRAPVEVAARPAGQFVAVLQRDAASPAFIMTVDVDTKSFTVRRVSAEAEAGKSYELWLVSDRFPGPRSLGVIGDSEFTRAALAAFDQDTISAATYAVSVEPQGGSTTGAPTGPVVFAGKLVEAVPPATPAPSR